MELTSRTLTIRTNMLAFTLIYGFLSIDEAVAAFNHYDETHPTNADEIMDALSTPDNITSPAPWFDAENKRIVCNALQPKDSDDEETRQAKKDLIQTIAEQRKSLKIHYVDKKEIDNTTTYFMPGMSSAWSAFFDIFNKKFLRKYSSETIVDIAIDQGGNCAITTPGVRDVKHGVILEGIKNIPGMLAESSTFMYAANMYNLVKYLTKDGYLNLDESDDIVSGMLTTKDGKVVHAGALAAMGG